MAKKNQSMSAFQSIDATELDSVTGGRWIPRKGVDPVITQGMKGVVDAIGAAGAAMNTAKQAESGQMQQMMQMIQQKRGG